MSARTRLLILTLGVLTMCPASAADALTPEAVVQAHIDAYNAHNLPAMIAAYAEDAEIYEHPAKLLFKGREELSRRYTQRFLEPNTRVAIVKRIVLANFVVDHEHITRTFPEGTGTIDAIVTSEVKDGKIVRAWLIYGPKVLDAKP